MQREADYLGSKPKPEEIAAGVKRFKKYGSYPQIRTIMKAHGLTSEQVQDLEYSDAFTILRYEKEVIDYTEKLQKIYATK